MILWLKQWTECQEELALLPVHTACGTKHKPLRLRALVS